MRAGDIVRQVGCLGTIVVSAVDGDVFYDSGPFDRILRVADYEVAKPASDHEHRATLAYYATRPWVGDRRPALAQRQLGFLDRNFVGEGI